MDGEVDTEGRAVDRREGGEVEISSKWREYKDMGGDGGKSPKKKGGKMALSH